jgi:hypothetical protein
VTQTENPASWHSLYRIGAAAAIILVVYSLVTMLVLVTLGGQPPTAQETFAMLQSGRLAGLLRLDLLTVVVMPLYYVLFLGIFTALQQTQRTYAALGAVLGAAGVTLFLATPSVFSWLALSDKFAAAANTAEQTRLLAAGEAILASDMWHGSGALVGGVLLQTGAVLVSVAMLGSQAFAKLTAYVGVVTHGLDLVRLLIAFFFPTASVFLMVIAGPLYLLWFPLVARDFSRLGRGGERVV